MYIVQFAIQNVVTRKARASLTLIAIAISIAIVFTMGVLTHSLRETAISILRTGAADFTIAQKGVSDVVYSSLDEADLDELRQYPGVASAVGVLVDPIELDSKHPFFLQLGVPADQLENFGVQVVAGSAYEPAARDEIMLGFRTAREFEKTIGDQFAIEDRTYRVVGIYSTGQVYGDSAVMLPLPELQADERKPGVVTLAFIRVTEGADIDGLRSQIEADHPELATVRTESEFGQIDRNLELISAANAGVSALALVIGAVSVMNTMMLTVFERTREFGVLRALGWARSRVLLDVVIEASMVTLAGALAGIAGGFLAVRLLEDAPDLVGVFQPVYPAGVFARALAIAAGMAFVGALYPALRAALLAPLEAIRHE